MPVECIDRGLTEGRSEAHLHNSHVENKNVLSHLKGGGLAPVNTSTPAFVFRCTGGLRVFLACPQCSLQSPKEKRGG